MTLVLINREIGHQFAISQACRMFLAMNPSDPASRKARDAAKAASHREDAERLANGEDPKVLQRENSIFPEDFFKKGRIRNLAEAVGR